MSKQIPRKLLPHSGTYYSWVSTDGNGEKTFSTGVPLLYVRFEPPRRSLLSSLGEFSGDRAFLFVDGKNSSPVGQVFKKFDEIEFNGDRYSVREAEPLYTVYSWVHHWEIYLT